MSEREPLVGAPRTIAKLYRELTAANAVVEAGKRIHYHLGHYRQSRGEKDYQQLRLADELLGEALDKLQGGSDEETIPKNKQQGNEQTRTKTV